MQKKLILLALVVVLNILGTPRQDLNYLHYLIRAGN